MIDVIYFKKALTKWRTGSL